MALRGLIASVTGGGYSRAPLVTPQPLPPPAQQLQLTPPNVKLSVSGPTVAANVVSRVQELVLDNVKRLFLLLAPDGTKRSKNSSKRPLINIIFHGLRREGKACVDFVCTHVLPTIPKNTLLAYLVKDKRNTTHDLFTKCQRETISKVNHLNEALVIKKVLVGADALEMRSGARTGTVFRVKGVQEMWGEYVRVYDKITEEADRTGISIPKQPRCKKNFWYAVMAHVRMLKKNQAWP